jgi:hypothetical protein
MQVAAEAARRGQGNFGSAVDVGTSPMPTGARRAYAALCRFTSSP